VSSSETAAGLEGHEQLCCDIGQHEEAQQVMTRFAPSPNQFVMAMLAEEMLSRLNHGRGEHAMSRPILWLDVIGTGAEGPQILAKHRHLSSKEL
jgi:hypothetical protein